MELHKELKLCVYTALIGKYEQLNEQLAAKESSIPFICFTDDPDLTSETWTIKRVDPLFTMDPIRSQREIKLRPHTYLPEYDASLYIDNTVILTKPPEILIKEAFPSSGFGLARHSYRQSVLEEFLEVSRRGLDDQSRIFEQLHHYMTICPDVLDERPYWGGIQIRDHREPLVRSMLDIWLANIHRYSRRDQLSANFAFRQAGLVPDILNINNHASEFHNWPIKHQRRSDIRKYQVDGGATMADYESMLEQDLADMLLLHERKMVEQARQIDAVYKSRSWVVASLLIKIADRFPRIASLGWRGFKQLY